MRLGELALEAGLPEGVLNVVVGTGADVGWRFVEHPDVRKIAFTGSTAVGKRIMAGCADQVKRVTLELGGKSANIVFADADLDKAASAAPGAVFDNSGQDCCARAAVCWCSARPSTSSWACSSTRARQWTVGDPMDTATAMGPLVTAEHLGRVRSFTDGLDTVFTGEAPSGPGFWHPIMIVAPSDPTSSHLSRRGVRPGCRRAAVRRRGRRHPHLQRQRLRVVGFDLDGRRVAGVATLRERWRRGRISVNSNSSVRYSTPFGGFKQSGLGREHSMHVLDHYTELKNVFVAT